MNKPITIVLADDHALIRMMLGDHLAGEPDMVVVETVGNANDVVTVAIKQKPDIILMDIDMPGTACFDAARTILDQCPDTRIIFLSAFFHDRYIEQALLIEASGYLTKSVPPESVIEAIRTVASGGSHYSTEVQERVVIDDEGTRLASQPRSRSSMLTPRELSVLRHIARSMGEKEIARELHVSPRTVHCHTTNLMNKLDIHSRVALTRFAIREGLATP
ncbi:MAG: response regulator transcription factor [bacterium]|nr:response regulator transcription factor [bacterium]